MKFLLPLILLASGCYGTMLRFPRPEIPSARLRRSTHCDIDNADSKTDNFGTCIDSTTDAFGKAIDNLDGRPDFLERKICNAMEGMMNCFVEILPCFPEDMREEHMESQVRNIEGIVEIAENFDEEKCPYYTWFKEGYKTQPYGISSSSNVIASVWVGIFFGFISIKLM